jgi:uncharacterized protein
MNEIFFNQFGRLRSGWRFTIFLILFSVVSAIFGASIVLVVDATGTDVNAEFLVTPFGFIITSFISLIPATIVGWFCGKMFEGLPIKALGWAFHKSWFTQMFFGLIVGGFAIIFAAILSMPTGGLSFSINKEIEFSTLFQSISVSAIVLLIAAASEEVLFRGYILQTLVRAKLAWLGILITSLPFAMAHLGNPSADIFSTLNTALAGIWLGLAYLKTRSLWFVLGIHFAWNWIQGSFLGLPISGLTSLTKYSLLQVQDQGPKWLTGGDYGIEGGIACVISILVSMAIVWFIPFIKADDEMMALTSRETAKSIQLS